MKPMAIAEKQATLVPLLNPRVSEGAQFLALGGKPPAFAERYLHTNAGSSCAGIVLLGRVDPAKVADVLKTAADPAIPIADFGGNDTLRRDFVGMRFDRGSLNEIGTSFSTIWRRLSEIPFNAEHRSRDELTILRIAYSRDTAINAAFAPQSRHIVEYPLLGTAAPAARRRLEMLAGLDLLHRRHFTRTHSCDKCESARLHVYEACPACGSANLREETVVHHYRCGCQEIESHFAQGDLLICPKCHRTLHHIGVDYGKPGKAVLCASCGATNSEPSVRFACLDCSSVQNADDARAIDWFNYDLTEEGIRALREGRLPQFDITPLLEGRTHTYSPREFRLLAMHEIKVAERLKRPFSVARFTVLNLDELIRERGAIAADDGFRRIADAVASELRSSDFVGVGTNLSGVIGFPATSSSDIDIIVKRIRRAIDSNSKAALQLGVEVAEGDAIIEMLAKS
jgi:GGDEF domain-containing protein